MLVGEETLKRGELVCFGNAKIGAITRCYPMEDKYAIKVVGHSAELRGENGAFLYFRREELRRAAPPPQEEPPLKQQRLEAAAPREIETEEPSDRLLGRVKWYSKEKGFGKIVQAQESGEDVFVHRTQMQGGPDGLHARAITEGLQVTFGFTRLADGKLCACDVQVKGLSKVLQELGSEVTGNSKGDLLRRLLLCGLQVGTFQERGFGKASMEDRFIVRTGVEVDALGGAGRRSTCAFFGVYDGHAGASCSDFVGTSLDRAVFESLRQQRREGSCDLGVRSALLAAYRMTEHNYFQYLNKLEGGAAQAWATAGSTACSVMFFGPDEESRLRLAVANAGDSRAVLGRTDGRAVRLSDDHTPDVLSERKRIESAGAGVVLHNGIWRIVLRNGGSTVAGLSVSRGFGDLQYKMPSVVVSAVPDITFRTVDLREDSFIIVATDGVWGPISDADAVRIVSSALREGVGDPPKHAAQQLVQAAHAKDPSDDKTVLVMWFGDTPAPMPGPAVRSSAEHGVSEKAASADIFSEAKESHRERLEATFKNRTPRSSRRTQF